MKKKIRKKKSNRERMRSQMHLKGDDGDGENGMDSRHIQEAKQDSW